MKKLIKSVFGSFRAAQTSQLLFLTKEAQFRQAQLIIRIFYVIIFLLESQKFSRWTSLLNKTNIDPIWPVYWLNYVNIQFGILCILYLGLCSSLLAITFPNLRITRFLVFLSLLEFTAFNSSFGKINHDNHLSILLSFILIFLPTRWDSLKKVNRYTKNATLIVFASCQSFIMLTYTMAGFGKIFRAILQGFQGFRSPSISITHWLVILTKRFLHCAWVMVNGALLYRLATHDRYHLPTILCTTGGISSITSSNMGIVSYSFSHF